MVDIAVILTFRQWLESNLNRLGVWTWPVGGLSYSALLLLFFVMISSSFRIGGILDNNKSLESLLIRGAVYILAIFVVPAMSVFALQLLLSFNNIPAFAIVLVFLTVFSWTWIVKIVPRVPNFT